MHLRDGQRHGLAPLERGAAHRLLAQLGAASLGLCLLRVLGALRGFFFGYLKFVDVTHDRRL